MNTPFLKILVACHKPGCLLKSDIYLPVHCGRAVAETKSKDGLLSKADLQWLKENTAGDDTGENISSLNRHFAEMTAVYWAWKNYAALGNPQYIGLNHYRRIFDASDEQLKAVCARYDWAAFQGGTSGLGTVEQHFRHFYHNNDLQKLAEAVSREQPEYARAIRQYLNGNKAYWCNMFIMKKEAFFEYCAWIFPILFKFHKGYDYAEHNEYEQRMPGMMAERLTGIYLTRKTLQGKNVCPLSIVSLSAEGYGRLKPARFRIYGSYVLNSVLGKIFFGKKRLYYKTKRDFWRKQILQIKKFRTK